MLIMEVSIVTVRRRGRYSLKCACGARYCIDLSIRTSRQPLVLAVASSVLLFKFITNIATAYSEFVCQCSFYRLVYLAKVGYN
jgi:hypothetical protein